MVYLPKVQKLMQDSAFIQGDVPQPETKPKVFVFGSNESGIHGAGAAKFALKLGAVIGVGFGRQGNTFGIPTKDWDIKQLPFDVVEFYTKRFIAYAKFCPFDTFQVTRIGCGLAGFTDEQMAPLYVNAPANCEFDEKWGLWLPNRTYWGTF